MPGGHHPAYPASAWVAASVREWCAAGSRRCRAEDGREQQRVARGQGEHRGVGEEAGRPAPPAAPGDQRRPAPPPSRMLAIMRANMPVCPQRLKTRADAQAEGRQGEERHAVDEELASTGPARGTAARRTAPGQAPAVGRRSTRPRTQSRTRVDDRLPEDEQAGAARGSRGGCGSGPRRTGRTG